MFVHLGMTGKFFFENKRKKYKTSFYYNLSKKKNNVHDRVVFSFRRKKKINLQ